jgi:hypothetical protein
VDVADVGAGHGESGHDPGVVARRAATAYAVGWAGTGGPLTDRVRIGARVAADLAADHRGTPGVVEATLQLGALEGTWARIYARRDVLYTRHDWAVRKAWHDYTTRALDVPALVAAVRRAGGVTEAQGPGAAGQDERDDAVTATVLAALVALLQRAGDTLYQALVAAITAALIDGTAEGTAGGIALAARRAGYSGINFTRAFTDARAAAAGPDQHGYYVTLAGQWLRRMVDATGRVLGRRLGRLVRDGATPDELADETGRSGTGRDVSAVSAFTDWALGWGFTLGAVTVFAGLGMNTVNWVTAGGTRVCPVCQDHEDRSPFPLVSAPTPPAHPSCRCVLDPAGPVDSLRRFGQYLIGGS